MELIGIKQLYTAINNKLHSTTANVCTNNTKAAMDIKILRALSAFFNVTINKACEVVSYM